MNLYGPHDNFGTASSHVIPALIRKCFEAHGCGADHIVAWGDGTPTREFLYVEDCAEGIVLAAERHDPSEPVNLGSSSEISIKALAELIASYTGFGGEVRRDTTQPNGQPRRKLNVCRAEQAFGFHATTPLAVGLARTINWYRESQQARR